MTSIIAACHLKINGELSASPVQVICPDLPYSPLSDLVISCVRSVSDPGSTDYQDVLCLEMLSMEWRKPCQYIGFHALGIY